MHLELAARPCPFCNSAAESRVFLEANFNLGGLDAYGFASRKTPEYMNYRMLECADCDLLYASPVPNEHSLTQAYRDAAFDSAEESHWAARTYARLLAPILRRLPDRDGALDIGAGDGAFLEQLLRAGFTNIIGIEPASAPIAAARAHIRPLIHHDIFRGETLAPGTFSLITCFQTLEHLPDPLAVSKHACRLLKPAGIAFFIVHDRRALSARLLGRNSPIFDIQHLQLFSPRSGQKLLKLSGFADIRDMTIWNCYPLHYWCRLLPLPGVFKSRLAAALRILRTGHFPLAAPAGNLALIGCKPRRSTGGR